MREKKKKEKESLVFWRKLGGRTRVGLAKL
jgi:hypothetical protein